MTNTTNKAAMSPDRLVQTAVKELYSIVEDYKVEPSLRTDAVRQIVDVLRNVMSVSDSTRLMEEIRLRELQEGKQS